MWCLSDVLGYHSHQPQPAWLQDADDGSFSLQLLEGTTLSIPKLILSGLATLHSFFKVLEIMLEILGTDLLLHI